MSITMLVVSITMLTLFVCSSVVSAQNNSKFVYNKDKNVETVYTLDQTGKYLTPKLKYEYSKNDGGKSTSKIAYRWNAFTQSWTPYYLLTLLEVENNSVVEYAVWNDKTNDFSLNSQKAVYNRGLADELLSYVSYRWNQSVNSWEVNHQMLLGDYLAMDAAAVN